MMEKSGKKVAFLFLAFVFASFLISFVSAQYYGGYGSFNLQQGSEQLIGGAISFAEPFLQVLLGGQYYDTNLLFEKLLLFILLLSIIYLSLGTVPMFKGDEQKGVRWIITIIVPLIAVRFMDFMWLNTIILQYQVLGIALTAILPFLLYLFFLHGISDSKTIRKIGWIFFIVIYYFLWSSSSAMTYGEAYMWTAILALVFLLFDGTIHRYLVKSRLEEGPKSILESRYLKTQKELADTLSLPESELRNKKIKKLEHDMKFLEKHLSD